MKLTPEMEKRAEEQHAKVCSEPTYSTRLCFCPDRLNPDELTADEFVCKALKYGRVFSIDEFVTAFNSFNLGDVHPDIGTLRVCELADTCVEFCPHCECEVLLKMEFKLQQCPVCGQEIAPCNICGSDCTRECPLRATR